MKLLIQEFQLHLNTSNWIKMQEKKIWANFLSLTECGGKLEELAERLSGYELNGRQIRTAIQLSQALSQSEGIPINFEIVERTLNISSQFDTDLGWEKLKFKPVETYINSDHENKINNTSGNIFIS